VTAAGPDFMPPAERVAVFDNDGTLWCEKPMYIQLDYILRQLSALAEKDQSLRLQQPWKAAYEKDFAYLGAAVTKHYEGDSADMHVILGGIVRSLDGNNVEDIEAAAGDFVRNQQHPTLPRKYAACGYKPMIELLRYLEAHGFANYIISGGGRDFMRAISEEMYGVPRDRVVGSSVALAYEHGADGGRIVQRPELDVMDDGPVKPARIWSRVGRRPLVAAGNSNGDIEMLEFAGGAKRGGLRLLVLHDDAEREFAYVAGAERSLELAGAKGWNVVSMKTDWATVFAG
jgi:phosphoserine phosphatase